MEHAFEHNLFGSPAFSRKLIKTPNSSKFVLKFVLHFVVTVGRGEGYRYAADLAGSDGGARRRERGYVRNGEDWNHKWHAWRSVPSTVVARTG